MLQNHSLQNCRISNLRNNIKSQYKMSFILIQYLQPERMTGSDWGEKRAPYADSIVWDTLTPRAPPATGTQSTGYAGWMRRAGAEVTGQSSEDSSPNIYQMYERIQQAHFLTVFTIYGCIYILQENPEYSRTIRERMRKTAFRHSTIPLPMS